VLFGLEIISHDGRKDNVGAHSHWTLTRRQFTVLETANTDI